MGQDGNVRGETEAPDAFVRRRGNRRLQHEEVAVERRQIDRRARKPGLDALLRVVTESGEEQPPAR